MKNMKWIRGTPGVGEHISSDRRFRIFKRSNSGLYALQDMNNGWAIVMDMAPLDEVKGAAERLVSSNARNS